MHLDVYLPELTEIGHFARSVWRYFSSTCAVLRYARRISYGVYLWHYLLALYSESLSGWVRSVLHQPTMASLLSFGLTLLLITLIAQVSYRYLERPFLLL